MKNPEYRKARYLCAAVLYIVLMVGAPDAIARNSRDDLVAQMIASLTSELPDEIKGIAFMKLENTCRAPLDIDLLREDLELELIGETRFDFINRQLLDTALVEMDLCSGMSCFIDPEMMQEFGKAKGIDAFLIGDVIDSSTRYVDLDDKDYFLTVLLRAMSTATTGVVWQKEITGINTEHVVDVLGALPEMVPVTKEADLARSMADFLNSSEKIELADIRTVSLMDFENRTDSNFSTDAMFRQLANAIVSDTQFKLVDREYMKEYLKEQGLWFDRIADATQMKNIGRLYGIDAFIYGSIRDVTNDRIECVVRINDVETNVDVDAVRLTGTARNMEWSLANMLRNVEESRIVTSPVGADVLMDGRRLGQSPQRCLLTHGDHSLSFSLRGYRDTTLVVAGDFAQAMEISVQLFEHASSLDISSNPPGAAVQFDGEWLGSETPISGLETVFGEHSIVIKKDGYLPEALAVEVNRDRMSFNFALDQIGKSRSTALFRSLLLPGMGQHYKEQHGKGWLFTLAAFGAAEFAYVSEMARDDAVYEYEAALELYSEATSQDQRNAASAIMERASAKADDKESQRNTALMILGGVWAVNLIDAAVGFPLGDAGVNVGAAGAPDGQPSLTVTYSR